MNIKPTKTDADYQAALKETETLMMAEPDTPEGEKLDVLATLIEAYEAKHYPLDLPDPVEAIKFEMDRKGLTVKDLEAAQQPRYSRRIADKAAAYSGLKIYWPTTASSLKETTQSNQP